MLVKLNNQLNLPIGESLVGLFSKLEELGVERVRGKKVLFVGSRGSEVRPLLGWGPQVGIKPIPLPESGQYKPLAALDSSVAYVAETEDGSVYVAKAALVISTLKRRKVHVIGPFIICLGEDTVKEFARNFSGEIPPMILLMDRQMAMRGIRVLLERHIASVAASLLKDGLILLDGSLRLSLFEPKDTGLDSLLEEATTVAISKASRIKLVNRIASVLLKSNEACFVEITGFMKTIVKPSLGRSFVVKLETSGLPFRADLPSHADPKETFSSLRSSDMIIRGYPESLRIAHLLSVFTAAEIAALKGIIASQAGEILATEDLRKVVLGSLKI